jgi:dihydroxyacetone kinase-like protein
VTSFSTADLRRVLVGMIARVRECEEELNVLDAELGDGDLGTTLVSVADAVGRVLPTLSDKAPSPDVGAALTRVAEAIGGASGSSFSSLLIVGLSRAGVLLRGKSEVSAEEYSQVLKAALTAMLDVSGTQVGDKTVLDVIVAMTAVPAGKDIVSRIHETLQAFRPKACRAGRARVAAHRSVGRDDPGMVAMLRLVEGAAGHIHGELT